MSLKTRATPSIRQHGYTMVEVLISLLIGAIMIGSVLVAVTGTGMSGQRQGGHAQIGEDGQIALNLLTNQLRMTGFWQPGSPVLSLHPQQNMLFGCRNGFANVTIANFTALTCTAGTGNDSVAIRYDGREPGVALPADCLGNTAGIPTAGALAGWVDNRYYIANSASGNPALFCRGNGGGAAQMLIDNVETLQLRYGIATANAAATAPELFERNTFAGQTIRYVRAGDLVTGCQRTAPINNSWCSVTVVRVCIVMRSAPGASDQAGGTPFVNCDGATQTIADTRLRRAMTTTVSLRNRMP